MRKLNLILTSVGVISGASGVASLVYSSSLSQSNHKKLEHRKQQLKNYLAMKQKSINHQTCRDPKTCVYGLNEYKKEKEKIMANLKNLFEEIEQDESFLIPVQEWNTLSKDIQEIMAEMSFDYCQKSNAKIISKTKELFFGDDLGSLTIYYDSCLDEQGRSKELNEYSAVIIEPKYE